MISPHSNTCAQVGITGLHWRRRIEPKMIKVKINHRATILLSRNACGEMIHVWPGGGTSTRERGKRFLSWFKSRLGLQV